VTGIARNRPDGTVTLHAWVPGAARTVCGLVVDRGARVWARGRGDAPAWEVLGLDANEHHCRRCRPLHPRHMLTIPHAVS
jgi:hypothetical protein